MITRRRWMSSRLFGFALMRTASWLQPVRHVATLILLLNSRLFHLIEVKCVDFHLS